MYEIKTLLDMHTHTVASGHAYSTLQEMVDAAAEKGLQYLGITEHTPGIPGVCHPMYFRNIHVIPRLIKGVHLLIGAELNIMDYSGTMDLDENYYKLLDIRIAGIHALCWKGGTREQNTEGLINAIRSPWTDIISHPGDGTAELDLEPVVMAARDTQTLLEINSSSLKPIRNKMEARENNLQILRLSKQYDIPIILGSDAHISYSVADYRYALPLLEETNFPLELVVNDKPDLFFEYTGLKVPE